MDEEISVQRQLNRGRMIREHNIEVKKTGQGVFWEERVTDNNETVSLFFNHIYKEKKRIKTISLMYIRV